MTIHAKRLDDSRVCGRDSEFGSVFWSLADCADCLAALVREGLLTQGEVDDAEARRYLDEPRVEFSLTIETGYEYSCSDSITCEPMVDEHGRECERMNDEARGEFYGERMREALAELLAVVAGEKS